MPSPSEILKQYWGYDVFRPLQEDIINSILKAKDTLALLPTGGGKSICYQVPALVKGGLCLVISPLIALMKDQVEHLQRRGITAEAIVAGQFAHFVEQTLQNAAEKKLQFLYVSPERLETKLFKAYLSSLPITLIAIDEAHCISQWGYDFRPPYLRIAALREYLPNVPFLALTASATPTVQQDICEKLQFKAPNTFRQSFARPNLRYAVRQPQSKIEALIKLLKRVEGTSIVYARNRKRTKEIATTLQQQGISADYYHAGLTAEERSEKQEAWIQNRIRCMICTNAFGMGIDKPDVRLVIHMDIPDCLESYYQEAGRAGRDGNTSYAILLYRQEDIKALDELPDQKFPSIEIIQDVYQALANHLQIAVGQGEATTYPFHLTDFLHYFKLDARLATNALQVLAQEEYIYISDAAWQPTTVGFITDRYTVDEWVKTNPTLEPLIKALLRTYKGIFDNEVAIREAQLTYMLRKNKEELHTQLQQLQQIGIINYTPRSEIPQLTWLFNRTNATALNINYKNYFDRKQQYIERIKHIKQFVVDIDLCRSQYIGKYFGDAKLERCGVCDNCRQQAKNNQSFNTIFYQTILERISIQGITVHALLKDLKQYPEKDIWQAIRLLQQEEKIIIKEEILLKK